MEEDEHEVYGGDIPDMEGDMEVHQPDVDMARPDDDDAAAKELDEMKKRLKEMEEEAAALREMQAKVEKEMGAVQDKFGQPKGFAYVEFLEMEAIQNALLLNESELHGRQLKVSAKRTNIPGMKAYRGRRFNPYLARYRRPFMPPPYFYSPYGYGKFPRYRRPMRYRPYY